MNKVLMIIGIAFIGFVIVLGVSIGSRLNEQTVTMLVGLTCGTAVALPIGLALGLYLGDRRRRDREAPTPPIVIMHQPQQSPSSSTSLIPPPFLSPPRTFNIIGDNRDDAT